MVYNLKCKNCIFNIIIIKTEFVFLHGKCGLADF